jgi:threonyl-tRNA synthetase
MPNITLPDGSIRSFDNTVTGQQLAESIGAGLAKAAVAIKVNGQQRDLSEPLNDGDKVAILTLKDPEGLEIMRHTTTAQSLARAVRELFPGAVVAMGPTIDDGFYHDISYSKPLTPEDLPRIEKRMLEIIEENNPVCREIWDKAEVIKYFGNIGNKYKPEILERVADNKISVYRQTLKNGESFIDMCVGPHVTSTGKISKSFKLTKLAGAYWRGDSNNEQLQRIYGVSFANDKELKEYLHRIEEAEKRDHRKLGTQLNLFHVQEEATGQVFWHPRGWTLYRTLENFIRDKISKRGYVEVKTPMLVDRVLWEKSGHWDKYLSLIHI